MIYCTVTTISPAKAAKKAARADEICAVIYTPRRAARDIAAAAAPRPEFPDALRFRAAAFSRPP